MTYDDVRHSEGYITITGWTVWTHPRSLSWLILRTSVIKECLCQAVPSVWLKGWPMRWSALTALLNIYVESVRDREREHGCVCVDDTIMSCVVHITAVPFSIYQTCIIQRFLSWGNLSLLIAWVCNSWCGETTGNMVWSKHLRVWCWANTGWFLIQWAHILICLLLRGMKTRS